jgi:hypothetical protein
MAFSRFGLAVYFMLPAHRLDDLAAGGVNAADPRQEFHTLLLVLVKRTKQYPPQTERGGSNPDQRLWHVASSIAAN